MKKLIFLICILLYLFPLNSYSQEIKSDWIQNKWNMIDTILTCFKINYVYPETASQLKDSMDNKKGEYSKLTDLKEFLTILSSDIRKITRDKHFGINFIENSDNAASKNKHSLLSEELNEKKRQYFSFKKVEWFPGNVGYLRFDRFENPQYAGESAISAINILGNCDAIIIDLRYNYGGEEKMVKYLASYFFDEPTLLNTLYFTKQDSSVQSWTDSYLPSKKLIDKDVYILTSPNTASGAEAFTYILKNYHKAIVIGEKTRGAAHWVEYFYYPSLKLEVKLPVARPINPVTKTNWENTGINPDIEISEHMALNKTYIVALERLIKTNDGNSKSKALEWYKQIALEKYKKETMSQSDLNEYVGQYGELKFLVKNNYLYWNQGEGTEFVLIQISKDHFMFDDSDDYVVKFVRDNKGFVTGYQLLIKGRDKNPIREKTDSIKK